MNRALPICVMFAALAFSALPPVCAMPEETAHLSSMPAWNRSVKNNSQSQIIKFSPHPKNKTAVVLASWYSRTDPGVRRHTANGEIFDDTQWTCAAWDMPFGTSVRVTNIQNGKSVICRVNDRGPRKQLGRKIDLSKAAFKKIADLRRGVIKVTLQPAALKR